MSAIAMTTTNTDFQIHKLFFEQCLKDIKIIVHNKSATNAASAIKEYMAKISIDKYNSDVRKILENSGLEPQSRCVEMIQLSEPVMRMLHQYQHTKRDDDQILKALMSIYDSNVGNQSNIILRIHLTRLLKIELSKLDDFYSSHQLIHLGKKSSFYFCTPTHCGCCKLFNYTDKTYMTLGYIAKLFQTHTTGYLSYDADTSYYDRHEQNLMEVPSSTHFDHNGYHYTVKFNCHMARDDIDKRTASFHIGNPITYTKTRSGDKTIKEEMKYIFLNYDSHGRYYDEEKRYYGRNFVVLTNDFDYKFDSFEKDTKASQQMKALVEEFTASNCGLSFFHYFLKKLPIEKQLLYVATFFTRQSVWRDY